MAENETNAPTAADSGGTPKQPKKKKSFFKSKWFKRIIIVLILAAAVAAFFIYRSYKASKEATAEATSTASIITRGDITVKITGSGTVEAYDEYSIVPTVTGTIETCSVEEGDYVSEGDVLYKFDSTVADNAIKTAQNSIKTAQNSVTSALNNITQAETTLSNRADDVQKAKDNIADLTIYANSTGKISGLNLTVGNDANGNICTITDTNTQLVKVPFNKSQFDQISVGDSVTLNIEKYMSTASGTVRRKYSAAGTGSDGSSVVYDVEILIDNSVTLPEGTIVTATVYTSSGNVTSSLTGSVYYPDPTAVIAEQAGKVQKVYVTNGDWVEKGAVIAQLESTSLQDALKTAQQNYTNAQTSLQEARNSYQNSLTNLENAQSTLEDRQSDADDYTITSPISGVVLSKSYKAGDTIYGTNSTTLMVIADMSKMKFTISVDELDIASIAIGQEVDVTSDALEGVELTGYITTISKMGTSSNGVTNYPVEVTIDEPGELMSGMNVSAEIIVSEAKNVIRVPVSAVSYFDGSYYATVIGEVEGLGDNASGARMPSASDGAEMPEGGAMPEGGMPEGEAPAADAESEDTESEAVKASAASSGKNTAAQQRRATNDMSIKFSDEEERVQIEIGISDDDYYEVISGLEVGQVVYDEGSTSSGSTGMMSMMGMMGGGGGGNPGGGGGGGAPGGGGGPR